MINRRQFISLTALSPLSFHSYASTRDHAFQLDLTENRFLLNQQPFQIRSGEMHPARIPKAYWRHRIQMAKAMGMNTIAIYVMWNYHEEQEGKFDFHSENRDIAHFIGLCQEEHLYVILRPGPYVCGEWDLGGIPAYLLTDENVVLRANSEKAPRYMQAVRRYIQTLANIIKPLMLEQGGPILMIQIENEFGSYGNDLVYLEELRQLWVTQGIVGPFYTQDGYEQLMQNKTSIKGGAIGLSGGESIDIIKARKEYPEVPVMCGELYPGWLTHWGDAIMQGKDVDVSNTIREMMEANQSFNIYVIHGGTNFGFSAGANTEKGEYQPDVTSYDYAAPINEQGLPTTAYFRYRNIIAKALKVKLPTVPKPIKTLKLPGDRSFTPQFFTSIWDHLPAAKPLAQPQAMESLGQYSGLILYQKRLGHANAKLHINELHDYATLHLDQRYLCAISRTKLPAGSFAELGMHAHRQAITLPPVSSSVVSILVEAMGRINYGRVPVDRKGILSPIQLSIDEGPKQNLEQWQVTSLPLDRQFIQSLRASPNRGRSGNFFKLRLKLDELGDCFIDLSDWTKGIVWVNGNNLGRYWKLGPQYRLYCPATFLRHGINEVLIFDHHQTQASHITIRTQLEG